MPKPLQFFLIRRSAAMLVLILCTPSVHAGAPPSPVDLDWLRRECGDGALAHHAAGRIYLTELAVVESTAVLPPHGVRIAAGPDGGDRALLMAIVERSGALTIERQTH